MRDDRLRPHLSPGPYGRSLSSREMPAVSKRLDPPACLKPAPWTPRSPLSQASARPSLITAARASAGALDRTGAPQMRSARGLKRARPRLPGVTMSEVPRRAHDQTDDVPMRKNQAQAGAAAMHLLNADTRSQSSCTGSRHGADAAELEAQCRLG